MEIDIKSKILIVGLGLIGGSYARALKKKGYSVSAITRRQSSIDFALKEGIIDYGTIKPEEKLISSADIVVFSLYPHIFIDWIEKYGKYLRPGTLVTDVTGVKESIVYKIQDILPEGVEFIAAHPMAGREVYGVENSDERIFKGANYIVTPTEKNSSEAVEKCLELGRLIGFEKLSVLSPREHDEMIGFLSQLTHCIAIALMTCRTDEHLEKYTGDSFRDLTRIARINDEMWSELFMLNKNTLIHEIDIFEKELDKLKKYLETGDVESMREMMRFSTERRAKFDKKTD